jgi:predicted lipid-binding transport protein (Tim44 family)
MKFLSLVLAAALLVVGVQADAKRLGGGKSVGKQSSNVTQSQSAPTAPAGASNAAAAKPATPAPAAAPAAAPKKPWGAMLGGLAAGLGLAWLASSLGLGGMAGAIGQMLMFGLLALAIMLAVGWFMRRRAAQKGQAGGNANSPFAFQGAGADATNPAAAKTYRPESVGNDASARPWERNSMAFDASKNGGSMIGSAIGAGTSLSGSQSWGIPADFDINGFLGSAKQNFITLQAAWDKSDISSLRSMMTDTMLSEIKSQLAEREQHTGVGANHTEVAALDAKLLGIEEDDNAWLASVEFSGMIKEDPSQSPGPFREVWNMTKSKTTAGGWLVAGVQALQ